MFEKFFGPKVEKERDEEKIEKDLFDAASWQFSEVGVNPVSMRRAFAVLREENKMKKYGFTNNRLLNIVKDCAAKHAWPIQKEDGSFEYPDDDIKEEIEKIRLSLPEEERGS